MSDISQAPQPTHVLRPVKTMWLWSIVGFVYLMGMGAWMSYSTYRSGGSGWLWSLGGTLVMACVISYFFSPNRVSLSVDGEGFTYRPFFGSYRYLWRDIEAIARNPRKPAYYQLSLRGKPPVTIADFFKPGGGDIGTYLARQSAAAGHPIQAPEPLSSAAKTKTQLLFGGIALVLILSMLSKIPAVRDYVARLFGA